MPTYTFRNTKTNEVFDKFMSLSARESYLQDNPELETVMSTPSVIAGTTSFGGRLPDGFKDILRNVKSKHPNSTGVNHLV